MAKSSVNPAQDVRKLANSETLGLAFVEWKTPTPDEAALALFAQFLSDRVAVVATYDVAQETVGLPGLGGLPVDWTRQRVSVFPVFIEKLVIAPTVESNVDGLALRIERQGEWHITLDALRSCEADTGAWDALIARRDELGIGGGLSVNTLELTKDALQSGTVDLRPLVLHALRTDGGATDRGRAGQQLAVSNSFWQTFWATGALRSQRGMVFPVAFLPIDRAWGGEFAVPFDERGVAPGRKLFGRTAILAWVNETLTREKVLLFDTAKNTFGVAQDFDAPAAGLCPADVALALYELNRTAFVDAYIGANKEVFAPWRVQEEKGERGAAFDATAIGAPTLLNPTNSGVAVIARVVPFAGAAYLSQVVHETARLREDGKIQDMDGEIVAATNSTFFLNFPEEYCNLHSAMNDPVATLVENGQTRQVRALRRVTFALSTGGDARITVDDVTNAVAISAEVVGAANAFTTAFKSGAENQYAAPHGAVFVGDGVVETFTGETDIPANGWIVGTETPTLDAPAADFAFACVDNADGSPMELRHAFAVGPMLLKDSQFVEFGTSGEEFTPIELREAMSAEETAALPRAAMPSALLNCAGKGTPPTRFPHDWNKTRAPRTALGVKPDGTVVLAVVDGRADLAHSIGVTLAETAQVMLNLGCSEAMNMDGGGSSVMFINDPQAAMLKIKPDLRDGVVNLPSDAGGVERMLPVPLVIVRN